MTYLRLNVLLEEIMVTHAGLIKTQKEVVLVVSAARIKTRALSADSGLLWVCF